ncbi:MAG: cell division protein (peptidoglycan synthetase) FtsI [Rhodobacteraceae bacterium HLUCCA12]|nr:MAG: cell division protein (peptidoglycan synthetase) FtsI [Rhodobacteraceae bacterium HLUCCA12]
MIRIPLRPLPRILEARAEGRNPAHIERENLRLRHEQMRDLARRRAEWRLLFLAALFFMGFALIGARMGLLAASPPHEPMPYQGEEIAAYRAEIQDRNGRILATNLVTNSLYAEMRYMVDGARAARELARIFPDIDAERLAARLTDPDRRFVWIRTRLSPEQVQAVHDIGEPGLLFGPREMRLYPNGRLAAHVLGGTSFGQQGVNAAEIVGTGGIEHRLDATLRDPDRAERPMRLSLDLTVQAIAAEVLDGGVSMLGARAGSATVMDARTGEIVAMVSLPDFDPNDRPAPPTEGDPTDSPLFNHAVQGVYELGSVMKAFGVAQALELDLVTPETMIDTRAPLRIGGHAINDFRNYGAEMSVRDVFVRSSNIGTARLAQMIGADRQRDFLQRFGFLEPASVELAETARARPQFPDRWTEISSMTISYGHGLSTSPLQLAAAYAALVNGGTRVEPTLLRRATAAPGERLISERTSAMMRALMRQVVTTGTASMAEVEGFVFGGKTGTADKPDPSGGYAEDRVIATFAGAFPLDDPRYVVVITLDEPNETSSGEARRTAGWTVVPVAAEIVRRTAPLLGLRPRDDARATAAIEAALQLR